MELKEKGVHIIQSLAWVVLLGTLEMRQKYTLDHHAHTFTSRDILVFKISSELELTMLCVCAC